MLYLPNLPSFACCKCWILKTSPLLQASANENFTYNALRLYGWERMAAPPIVMEEYTNFAPF